nr:acyltransferase domain-containing protein [Kineosporia babensis]
MPGQGAQYPGMGTGLYRRLEPFRTALDEVFDALGPAGTALREDWLSAAPRIPSDDARSSQPLLFALDYALGRVLLELGLQPVYALGHSVGELSAAALAGVFDLRDALAILQQRVAAVGSAPAGGMVAVAATRSEIEPRLIPGVDVAAVNAPRQVVLAGPREPLQAMVQALREDGFTCAPVPSQAPFHSTALRPLADAALPLLKSIPVHPAQLSIFSGYTTQPLGPEQTEDPSYWAAQPVDPVLFWPALSNLSEHEPDVLIECGPGTSLITHARRLPAVRNGRCAVVSLLGPPRNGPGAEFDHFSAAITALVPGQDYIGG